MGENKILNLDSITWNITAEMRIFMKRNIYMLCFVLITLLFLNGCGNKKGNQAANSTVQVPAGSTAPEAIPTPSGVKLKLQDYFPMLKDTLYSYEGTGNEYASYYLYNDYLNDNKVQQRINNGGTEAIRVIELKDGKLIRVFYRGEAYYKENFLNAVEGDPEVLLMEPLVVGNFWTLKGSVKRTITNTEAEVTTPTGSYKAIEVTTDTPQGKTLDYYSKNVGLVKSVFKSGELEVISTLKKIESNISHNSTVNFYYPVKGSEKLHYASKKIAFKTNDITKKLLEEAYKSIAETMLGEPASGNIKINSLYFNKDKIVYLDLNSAFVTEINKQKAYEKAILQSVANTFGGYYNAENVILTIDNRNYKSDNTSMKKDEALKVRLEGCIRDEIK